MSPRATAFFREATKNLNFAKEELFKPAANIVSFSVCKNSQFAIENYFKGFLVRNNIEFDVNANIGTLYELCLTKDKNFENIDLSAIGCKNQAIDSRYCSEINSVSACFDVADEIDTYFRKSDLL